MSTTLRLITTAALAGSLALAQAEGAAAAPPVPPTIPGPPNPLTPGSYQYFYNYLVAPAPATNDARGVRIGTNADPSQSAIGLPNSKLGNSPAKPDAYTSSSARNDIVAGITPAQAAVPGVNVGADQQIGTLEDPTGKPPQNATNPESAAPTVVPAGPASPGPILESASPPTPPTPPTG